MEKKSRRGKMKVIVNCQRCGKEFEIYPYQAKSEQGKYCSYECYWTPKVSTNCLTCGKEILTPPSRRAENRGKYCSRACSTQRHENNTTVKRHVTFINGKRRFDYQAIAEKALGRPLKKGEVVHHLDGNSRNCEPNNLVICTQSYHRIIHTRMEMRDKEARNVSRASHRSETAKDKILSGSCQ
jgi:hypothetical protein